MAAADITSGKCEICHQPVTEANPARLVVVRDGHGVREAHVGANVHIACLPDRRVVHLHDQALSAQRHGFIRRGH